MGNIVLEQGLPDGPIQHLYQEFRDNEEFMEFGYAGGFSCVHGDTRIYDAELDAHIPVRELYEMWRAPVVLAWNGSDFEPRKASVPFTKGKADLYRVTLSDGKTITATLEHRFLTPDGWCTLRYLVDAFCGGDQPKLLGTHGLVPSSWELAPSASRQDALRSMRTASSSQFCYQEYRRVHDARLLAAGDSGPSAAPSPDDAPDNSRDGSCGDGRAPSRNGSRGLWSRRPSSSSGVPRTSNQDKSPSQFPSASSSYLDTLRHWEALGARLFLDKSHRQPQASLSAGGTGQALMDASTFLSALAPSATLRTYWGSLASSVRAKCQTSTGLQQVASAPPVGTAHSGNAPQACGTTSYRSDGRTTQPSPRSPEASAHPQPLDGCTPALSTSQYSECTGQAYPSNDLPNDTHYTTFDKVEYVGHEYFYDMHVPELENYLAEGIVNHNTAKTSAMVDAALASCWNYPGAEVLIARGKGTDLRATTLVTLEQRGGVFFSMAGGSKNTNLGEYRFPPVPDPMNPGRMVQSVIRAIGLDRADLQDVMKSRQPFRVFLEEGNEMPPEAHNLSLLRARQKVYHKDLKERHRVQKLSIKWGLPFRQVQAYLGYSDTDLERPMLGLVGVKTIWNPEGNDHLWKRYVGVPYPEDGVTVEWAKAHIGIREEHIPPAEHQNPQRRYEFLPDDLVIHQGERRIVGCMKGKQVVLIPSGERGEVTADPKELTLVVQRGMLYAWPWMNKSGNRDNHKASFLIPDKEMAAKYFEGRVDVKNGLVLPQFDPTPNKGHVIKAPTLEQMKGHRAIGAVDHGGGHATAAVIFIVTWDDRLVAVREYVQAGLSASQNAYNIKGIIPPDVDVDWYCDPSMQRKAYETDAMSSAMDAYAEAGLPLQVAPAKGDEAVDIIKNMLVVQQDMYGQEKPKAGLYVSEKCKDLIQAFSELTWRDLSSRRDKWIVDIFDAAKYACAAKYQTRTSAKEADVIRGGPVVTRWAAAPNERRGMRV